MPSCSETGRDIESVFYEQVRSESNRPDYTMELHADSPGKPCKNEYFRRRSFQPLEAEERYRLIDSRWRAMPWESKNASDLARTRGTIHELWLATPRPTSFVAVPPIREFENCFEFSDVPPMTRAKALEAAAAANGAAFSDEEVGPGSAWLLIVELGHGMARIVDLELEENGMGIETRKEQQPFRLVMPTAEELAKYAV